MTPNLPTELTYNGYTFGPYTHVTVNMEMVEDEAQQTVVYNRYRIKAQTTIVADTTDSIVGDHFRRMRQRLSKAGQALTLNHAGFGPPIYVNSGQTGEPYDVNFGPKPRVIAWDPVGETNCVEVTWECEVCLPICDGQSGVRYTGLSTINSSSTYRIDKYGYTTRTVSGYLEIAMTRRGNTIPDSADKYRSVVFVETIAGYERESSWNLSADKRRLDFTITDTQINSPNAYAPGVIKISANHRVGFSKRQAGSLRNSITANIELADNVPRGRAWDIFRSIVQQRIGIAMDDNSGKGVMIETLDIAEELYSTSIALALTYRIIPSELGPAGAVEKFFTSSGLFTSIADWAQWEQHRQSLLPIQSKGGIAGLGWGTLRDIKDLCTDTPALPIVAPYYVSQPPPSNYYRLCNEKPLPNRSYVRFEAAITSIEDNPSTEQISIGGDDMKPIDFDPSDVTPKNGDTDQAKNIERFIEDAPAGLKFNWTGYCERLGYDIPKPGRLKFGDVTLIRHGKQHFRKKFLGTFFCQPLYAAAWNMTFVVDRRPRETPTKESDPYNSPGGT